MENKEASIIDNFGGEVIDEGFKNDGAIKKEEKVYSGKVQVPKVPYGFLEINYIDHTLDEVDILSERYFPSDAIPDEAPQHKFSEEKQETGEQPKPKPKCGLCGSEVYDNRSKKISGEYKSNAPDFKCMNKECQAKSRMQEDGTAGEFKKW